MLLPRPPMPPVSPVGADVAPNPVNAAPAGLLNVFV